MKIIELEKLDLKIYQEKLSNGLDIYIVPKCNVNNIYATFSTKYGSNQIEFVPIGKKKMVKVPLGIAHFLEHKLFEQDGKPDPFTFFSERGSDANANTNQTKTTYLFSGPNFFEENLDFLLDYVQSPYFTDENVKKEQGIITQEIKMYQDDPDTVLYESIIYNCFNEHPMKYPIIGDIKNINLITKEDLYTCYNTFYHPSNMFLVITGNVDPDKVIELVKENQEKKDFKPYNKTTEKTYQEPDTVYKKHQETKLNVGVSKCAIAFKIKIKNNDLYENLSYVLNFFDIKFGNTSLFYKQLVDEGILNESFTMYYDNTDKHIILMILANCAQPKILLDKITEELKSISIEESEFKRKMKTSLSSLLYISDNIFSLNDIIMNSIIKYGKIYNYYDKILNLNYVDFKKTIEKTDFSNYTTFIINTK